MRLAEVVLGVDCGVVYTLLLADPHLDLAMPTLCHFLTTQALT